MLVPAVPFRRINYKLVTHLRDDPDTSHVRDSTPNNNDGTKYGAGEPAVTTSGKIDDAQNFDGSNDYVNVSDSASLKGMSELTIEAWIYGKSFKEYGGTVSKWIYNGQQHYLLGYFQGGSSTKLGVFSFYVSQQLTVGASDYIQSITNLDLNKWYHIVGVFKGGQFLKVYVNGSEDNSKSTSITNIASGTQPVWVGRYADYYFNGTIDEVRISNLPRSSAWIKASYESERDDLVAYGSEENAEYDYVDSNSSNVDSSANKGTHSNFTAQKYGPDSVYDTLTEGKGGTTGITPITAFQDTQQSTTSTSLVDAGCGTSALSNGVVYLVIYCGNIGGNDNGADVELVLRFGTTTIARCTSEGTDQTTVLHCAAGACHGYYIVTGDGTSTLKFQFRRITIFDTAYAGAMGIVAIPLTALTQNSDYWYSVSNTEDIVTNPSAWTNLASQTWNLPETGNYLILMSAEGGCDGSSTADAPMVRFQLNGVTLGSEYMEEWEYDGDNMNFAKATVVNCNSGNNNFTIQVKDEDSSTPTADFHRPRIIVIKCSAFDQIVDTSTSTGVSTSSTTYVDWGALTTTYTPNQQEYVIVLANLNGLHNSYYHVPVFRIYDATASTAHREDSGEYGNGGYGTGHAAGADQLAAIAVAVKQQSSATQWKVQIRTEDADTAYYSQTGTGTGHRSDFILWGLSVANYELDLEAQWTGADYDKDNEKLCIYGGTMASEDIRVDVWNGSAWKNVFTDLASGWNNVSVSSYLTSSTFTIRFKGGTETSDTTQSNWKIDATLLHLWPKTYDYVLRVVNQVSDSWKVNLKVYGNSSLSRISSLNITFHDGTSSNQIAVSSGSIVKSEGGQYDLAGGLGSTVYISMSNLKATATGTSYIYTYLKIQKPNTTTYMLYVITFEIT